ncbi:beta-N-acetylhexosaminidase [soil metagenome]
MIIAPIGSSDSAARMIAALAFALAMSACAPPPPAVPVPVRSPSSSPLASLGAHSIVPAPASVLAGTGPSFALGVSTSIVVSPGSAEVAGVGEALATLLRPSTALPLPVRATDGAAPRGAIALRLGGAADLGAEGYEIVISADSIRLTAAAPAGLFHGVQTLRQLLPAGIEAELSTRSMASAWAVPPGRIIDRPRFAWRGAMLDVARHFFTVHEVEQYVDILALYKLNTLHLHLSDDQGWRVQIDSWPKLTAVGGSTQVGGGPGGYYTKQNYAAIVKYASDRFITIVPEIDMPGHTNAAIAAYPELGCSKPTPGPGGGTQAPGLYTGTEVGWSTFCPDSELTYRFVDDVVRELALMTPGPYLHIGGDEVHALPPDQFVRFVERAQDIVYKYGKTMVGWEEVGRARLRSTSRAQQWKSDSASLALKQGAMVILSPATKSYLDMKYTPATELGLDWAAIVELRTAYDWDPATYVRGVREQSIAGVEAALWTETVQNITGAEYLIMPRLPAIAEVGWSPESGREWESFRTRLAAHAARWRLLGINYYASPQVAW